LITLLVEQLELARAGDAGAAEAQPLSRATIDHGAARRATDDALLQARRDAAVVGRRSAARAVHLDPRVVAEDLETHDPGLGQWGRGGRIDVRDTRARLWSN
jgi:hypothetical protein